MSASQAPFQFTHAPTRTRNTVRIRGKGHWLVSSLFSPALENPWGEKS